MNLYDFIHKPEKPQFPDTEIHGDIHRYYKEFYLSDIIRHWHSNISDLCFEVELSEDEHFESSQSVKFDIYEIIPVLRVSVSVKTPEQTFTKYFYSRTAATEEDIRLLNHLTIKDAVIRFGLNKWSGRYSKIGKIISVILLSGSEYKLHGDKLPWHRFGDKKTDYQRNDYQRTDVFDGFVKLEDGTYKATYENTFWDPDEYACDCMGEVDEMLEYGAQFSWMD